jgi:tellurite resistance protein
MKLDEPRLKEALMALHGKLTRAEAAAIVDVARLAASVDGRMDLGEMATVAVVSKILYGMAGGGLAPVPNDVVGPQRLMEIGKLLEGTGARELAYATAVLVTHADQKITSEEAELARKLAEVLMLDGKRAAELNKIMGAFFGAS